MRIKLSGGAMRDLERGCDFYRNIDTNLAIYFYDCLASDIDSLLLHAGVHASVDGWHYTFSKRFPFVIWYGIKDGLVIVYAVLDGRSESSGNDAILRQRREDKEG